MKCAVYLVIFELGDYCCIMRLQYSLKCRTRLQRCSNNEVIMLCVHGIRLNMALTYQAFQLLGGIYAQNELNTISTTVSVKYASILSECFRQAPDKSCALEICFQSQIFMRIWIGTNLVHGIASDYYYYPMYLVTIHNIRFGSVINLLPMCACIFNIKMKLPNWVAFFICHRKQLINLANSKCDTINIEFESKCTLNLSASS